MQNLQFYQLLKALESFYHSMSKIVKCYLGDLAPFLEKEFFSISYNLEITQPSKPKKTHNLLFFQFLMALKSFYPGIS